MDLRKVLLYHITDVANLPGILTSGGLASDALMAGANANIGYDHIKRRRLTEIRVPCCGNRFVGEFVPFYFCPRSPMLYTVNRGNTGRPAGCQATIVHLVTTVELAVGIGRPWAVSDGNAGAYAVTFSNDPQAIDELDWAAIRATDWRGKTRQKSAELLIHERFPWDRFVEIGCQNAATAQQAKTSLRGSAIPTIRVKPNWYY